MNLMKRCKEWLLKLFRIFSFFTRESVSVAEVKKNNVDGKEIVYEDTAIVETTLYNHIWELLGYLDKVMEGFSDQRRSIILNKVIHDVMTRIRKIIDQNGFDYASYKEYLETLKHNI